MSWLQFVFLPTGSNKLTRKQAARILSSFIHLRSWIQLRFQKALDTLQPKGYTPLAFSLEKSGEDLIAIGKQREPERVIVVLSDGEETCGGDPVAVLQALQDKGIKVVVHTMGFNVDDAARKQLQAIAAFSCGKYFDAKDGAKLRESLQLATKEAFIALPTPTATSTPEPKLDKPRELFEGDQRQLIIPPSDN